MYRKVSGWFQDFWSTDRGLSLFLTLLLVQAFLMPIIVPRSPFGGRIAEVFFLLLLMAGVPAVSRRWWQGFVMFAVVFAAAALILGEQLVPSKNLAIWSNVSSIAVLGLFSVIVLAQVFREGRVTSNRIKGAVAAYLLLGLTWAAVYQLLAYRVPGAFTGAVPKNLESTSAWMYFSFVTMTTVGYGDITPVADVARSLAILEALTGQLYPAILIARLVSLELLHHSETPANGSARN